jgi:hypothetical protein
MTQPQCPSFLYFFLILLIYFSKFLCSSHQPTSVVNFGWRENHVEVAIMSTKPVCFIFRFWDFGGGGGCSPAAPPPCVRPCIGGIIYIGQPGTPYVHQNFSEQRDFRLQNQYSATAELYTKIKHAMELKQKKKKPYQMLIPSLSSSSLALQPF